MKNVRSSACAAGAHAWTAEMLATPSPCPRGVDDFGGCVGVEGGEQRLYIHHLDGSVASKRTVGHSKDTGIVFAKSALPSVSATDSSGAHAIDTGDRSALAAPGGYRASTPNAGSLRDENMTRCEVKSWPAEVPWLGAKRGGG
mmetsp:Transcript_22994/g.46035  ORF Transcript_22994/g.46035 Transcript_22994/m.46035 type:complete len:143 (+) Transcript_22994:183-611(+)